MNAGKVTRVCVFSGWAVASLATVAASDRDYEPGVYANARERAANTLKHSWYPSRFWEKIAAGKRVGGGYLQLADPVAAEAAGLSGLDFVWIDAEHHPFSERDILVMDIALKGTGCASLARLPSHDPDVIKRYLDTGIDGVIVPMVNTPEEAKAVIAACRYPQAGGCRGICIGRQAGYGKLSTADYLKRCETVPFVCLEIEHVDALKNVDAILALDGFDAIMVGPSDLSCSMGAIGKAGTPETMSIIKDIAVRTRAAGKLFYALSADWSGPLEGNVDLVNGPGDVMGFVSGARRFMQNETVFPRGK